MGACSQPSLCRGPPREPDYTGPGHSASRGYESSAFEVLNPGKCFGSRGGPRHPKQMRLPWCDKDGSVFSTLTLQPDYTGPGHSASRGYESSAFEVLNPGKCFGSRGGPRHPKQMRLPWCDKDGSVFSTLTLQPDYTGPGHSASRGYESSAFEVLNPGKCFGSRGGPRHPKQMRLPWCDKDGSVFSTLTLQPDYTGPGHSASRGYESSAFEVLNPGKCFGSRGGPRHPKQMRLPWCDKDGSVFSTLTLQPDYTGPGHSASRGYESSAFEVLNPGKCFGSRGGPRHPKQMRLPWCDKDGSAFSTLTLQPDYTGPGHSASRGYESSAFEVLNPGKCFGSRGGPRHPKQMRLPWCDKDGSVFSTLTLQPDYTGPGHSASRGYESSAFEVLNPGKCFGSRGGPRHPKQMRLPWCDKDGSVFSTLTLQPDYTGPGHSASRGYESSAFEVLNPGKCFGSRGGPRHPKQMRLPWCDKDGSVFSTLTLQPDYTGPGHSASRGYESSAFEVLNPGKCFGSRGGPRHPKQMRLPWCDKDGSVFSTLTLQPDYTGPGHSASRGYESSAFEVLNPGKCFGSRGGPRHPKQMRLPWCDKDGSVFSTLTLQPDYTGPGHSASRGYESSAFEVLNPGKCFGSRGGPRHPKQMRLPWCDTHGSVFSTLTLQPDYTGPGHSASRGYESSAFEVLLNPGNWFWLPWRSTASVWSRA